MEEHWGVVARAERHDVSDRRLRGLAGNKRLEDVNQWAPGKLAGAGADDKSLLRVVRERTDGPTSVKVHLHSVRTGSFSVESLSPRTLVRAGVRHAGLRETEISKNLVLFGFFSPLFCFF